VGRCRHARSFAPELLADCRTGRPGGGHRLRPTSSRAVILTQVKPSIDPGSVGKMTVRP
jgi:hypothetical protein